MVVDPNVNGVVTLVLPPVIPVDSEVVPTFTPVEGIDPPKLKLFCVVVAPNKLDGLFGALASPAPAPKLKAVAPVAVKLLIIIIFMSNRY